MKRDSKNSPQINQNGFITMIVMLLVILVAVIFFAFKRVMQVQQ